MAQHGKIDQANNAPIWATALVNKSVNTSNRDALYGNSTANAYFAGQTVAVVAIAANEISNTPGVASVGWQLRKVGTGGRAGRIQYECLAAGTMGTDAVDEFLLYFSADPTSRTKNTHTSTNISATGVALPTTTITYLWQANTGSGFANLTNAGVYSNVDTATMTISNTATLNAVSYRLSIAAADYDTAFSNGALLTVNAGVITINTQPLANSVSTGAPATFRVVSSVDPSNVTRTFQWELWGGASFANIAANSIYTNVTTANLVISDATGLNGKIYRVVIRGVDCANVTSSNALLTVT